MSHEEFPTEDPAVVTCGLPYANGDLHIGHMRGYISADAYARALRRLGQQTAYVCGSDMHGTPVAVNAAREGVDPETFALRHHERYAETFPQFNIEFDNYGHTHDETNTELTQEVVRALDEGGHIYEKEIKVAWDPDLDQPLPDRYVEGTCPYCGAHARGDECDEGCQRHLEPGEIEDPVSTVTGNPAEYRDRSHKFFRLSELQEYLQAFIDRLEGTANARNQPREWIEGELQDWCITRDMDWGIDYPGENDDLVLYVWVDAPIEYIASTRQYSERVGADEYDWRAVWKAAEGDAPQDASDGAGSGANGGPAGERGESDGEIVHVIGRDIIQHHTVFWPAMLRGSGYAEPRAVMATGFVTLDGEGFSTSRNRAVWAEEYLDSGIHVDLLRYYLTTASGLQDDVDFSWSMFRETVNSDLADTVGNFLHRALLFAARNFGGTPDADLSEDAEEAIAAQVGAYREALNDYSLKAAGDAAVELAAFGNRYIQRNEPWKLDDEEAAPVIRDCVQVAKAVTVLLAPFVPEKAEAAWDQIGEAGSVHEATVDACLAPPPASFPEPGTLFEKIEADTVEQLEADLDERIETAGGEDADEEADDADTAVEPLLDERVSFEEFRELDLRVGEVAVADPVEGADDLARLEVDIGRETRQVVAGIRGLYDLDELPGTRVVVVANLEPTELFGLESNGMVLAAGEEADLLTTRGDAAPGTRVE
jgi:methionyl-tRNA synthetase